MKNHNMLQPRSTTNISKPITVQDRSFKSRPTSKASKSRVSTKSNAIDAIYEGSLFSFLSKTSIGFSQSRRGRRLVARTPKSKVPERDIMLLTTSEDAPYSTDEECLSPDSERIIPVQNIELRSYAVPWSVWNTEKPKKSIDMDVPSFLDNTRSSRNGSQPLKSITKEKIKFEDRTEHAMDTLQSVCKLTWIKKTKKKPDSKPRRILKVPIDRVQRAKNTSTLVSSPHQSQPSRSAFSQSYTNVCRSSNFSQSFNSIMYQDNSLSSASRQQYQLTEGFKKRQQKRRAELIKLQNVVKRRAMIIHYRDSYGIDAEKFDIKSLNETQLMIKLERSLLVRKENMAACLI